VAAICWSGKVDLLECALLEECQSQEVFMRIRSLVGGLALTAATALALPAAAEADQYRSDRYYRGGKGYYGKGGYQRSYNKGYRGAYGRGYGYGGGSYYRGRPYYYAPRYYAPYAAPYYYPPPPPAYYGYGAYGGPHFSIHLAF
jgi:hypothetical protein